MDVSEGFDRPSFHVDIDNVVNVKVGPDGLERTISIIIYYFPTDKNDYFKEILEVQDKLEKAFTENLVIRQGFVVFPEYISSVKVDGVLQTSFDIISLEYKPEEEADGESVFMMGHLNFETKQSKD
ncbi:hypothetical protein G5B47_02555 [Paenibacillus sp. 7124]|uniref:Uncharacterized protein n=2 Tax=Paenibacillus apii TaxID=1850370 RepID=A0A6M1PDC9_9BACL|nr:hypothetical protein [Paenibacillus apii]